MKKTPRNHALIGPTTRCAIYTRKSTEEGLNQEFNSLDAQRESGENYVRSLAGEGWVVLSDRYDDGGFTGGNIERPALKRLMIDIEAGKVDAVVVYKVDRLSRSLLDFAQLIQTFDKHKVSFVSVTQQFNTASSMGRLVLNVLLSFAQFEREIISERTRDKIAATRRKGKWTGGWPILGYDVDPQRFKLIVNSPEADRVRAIFQMYLKHESLMPVMLELEQLGWINKRWQTRKGGEFGGKPFTRNSLYKLLTNVAYAGKVKYKDEVHEGEHEGIVDPNTWQRAQAILARNGRTGGTPVRNKFGAFLKGLLRCVSCQCAMTPSHSTRQGAKRYRYYVCSSAQKKGWHTCPSKSVPAIQIEELVVGQIRAMGADPRLLEKVLEQVARQDETRAGQIEKEKRGMERELQRWHTELHQLTAQIKPGADNASLLARLADLNERINASEQRVAGLQSQIDAIRAVRFDPDQTAELLSIFDPVWNALAPRQQNRIIELLVDRIDYDGARGKVRIVFRSTGIRTLAQERQPQEASA
jgi:site-specific DNA recombinase